MKIVLSATTSWNLFNSRLGLARELRKQGYDVVLLAPEDEFTKFLIEEGFEWHHFPLEPRGVALLKEFLSLIFLVSFYLKSKPDIVNHYTPKGVIYGSIAAKVASVPLVLNTITGLGYTFSVPDRKLVQRLFLIAYKVALSNTNIIFQNPDDQDFFFKNGVVEPRMTTLIVSSGVDMNRFTYSEDSADPPVVMLAARFVEAKGIRIFVDAAKLLKEKGVRARFVLIGQPEKDQPTAIPLGEISQWVGSEIVEWWGWHNQMELIYPASSIVCLPTHYKEGVPKSLIEAAACGRALIGTDVAGCREIISNGINGLLIPVKDPVALASAIESLLVQPKKRLAMGRRSRQIVEQQFSLEFVVEQYMSLLAEQTSLTFA